MLAAFAPSAPNWGDPGIGDAFAAYGTSRKGRNSSKGIFSLYPNAERPLNGVLPTPTDAERAAFDARRIAERAEYRESAAPDTARKRKAKGRRRRNKRGF